jgi:hypothetical protein
MSQLLEKRAHLIAVLDLASILQLSPTRQESAAFRRQSRAGRKRRVDTRSKEASHAKEQHDRHGCRIRLATFE